MIISLSLIHILQKNILKSLDENHPRAIEVKHMIELIEGEINAS